MNPKMARRDMAGHGVAGRGQARQGKEPMGYLIRPQGRQSWQERLINASSFAGALEGVMSNATKALSEAKELPKADPKIVLVR